MIQAGRLAISAVHAGGALAGIAVHLERPPAARAFIGRPPETVARTVPLLFSLCAAAQAAAARAALAAAQEQPLPPASPAALWTEALHEHLWRLLLDWPPALGVPAQREAFVAWRAARGQDGFARMTGELLAATLAGKWGAECDRRLGGDGAPGNFDLPAFCPEDWLAYWRGERAEAPPAGGPSSVAAAWQARRAAALQAAEALRSGQAYPLAAAGGNGWGIGQALTARGILTHAVRLEAGKVADYRVWAPTDRLFAGAAPLSALLAGGRWDDAGEAERALERAVLALDPCLPYELKVEHA